MNENKKEDEKSEHAHISDLFSKEKISSDVSEFSIIHIISCLVVAIAFPEISKDLFI